MSQMYFVLILIAYFESQWVPAKSQFGTKFQIFEVKIHVPKFGNFQIFQLFGMGVGTPIPN